MSIVIHRSEHAATVLTGPSDLALPFAVPMAFTATRAPELATGAIPTTAAARSSRNRRRASAARRRSAA